MTMDRVLFLEKTGLWRLETQGEIVLFCRHMAQLLPAGVPIMESLVSYSGSTYFVYILKKIQQRITRGQMLSEAFSAYPKLFGPLFCALVVMGEQTSTLPKVFIQLAAYYEWRETSLKKTKRALMYPLFMFLFLVALMWGMIIYILPQLIVFLKANGGGMPLSTRLLMGVGNFLTQHGMHILYVFSIIFLLCFWARFRRLLYEIWVRIPGVGHIYQTYILSHFFYSLLLLLAAKIPLSKALDQIATTVGGAKASTIFRALQTALHKGTPLSASMALSPFFPKNTILLIKTGETSGDMVGSLEHVVHIMRTKFEDKVQLALAVLPKVFLLFVGLMLMWLFTAVLWPLYDSFGGI